MSEDSQCIPLKRLTNPKGDVFRFIRKADVEEDGFGEVYFTHLNVGAAKGWKLHTEMILNLAVVVGCVRFVVLDEAFSKVVMDEILSNDNHKRLKIAPNQWVSFGNTSTTEKAVVVNCSNIVHGEDETREKELELGKRFLETAT